jgi:hypothetical protein
VLTLTKWFPANDIHNQKTPPIHENIYWKFRELSPLILRAGRSFLSKDPRRLFADLDTHGVICTRLGLFGAYTVFRVRDGQVTQFLSSKQFTIIDNLAENDSNWFDVWNPERQGSFPFTDIILLPRQRPECVFGKYDGCCCRCSSGDSPTRLGKRCRDGMAT